MTSSGLWQTTASGLVKTPLMHTSTRTKLKLFSWMDQMACTQSLISQRLTSWSLSFGTTAWSKNSTNRRASTTPSIMAQPLQHAALTSLTSTLKWRAGGSKSLLKITSLTLRPLKITRFASSNSDPSTLRSILWACQRSRATTLHITGKKAPWLLYLTKILPDQNWRQELCLLRKNSRSRWSLRTLKMPKWPLL